MLWFNCREILPGFFIAVFSILVCLICTFFWLDSKFVPDLDVLCSMAADRDANLERFRGENHTAFVLGYTGETGKAVVKELAKTNIFSRVVLFGRRKIDLGPEVGPNFEQKFIDFDSLDDKREVFNGLDVGFCCLGTTRGKAGVAGFVKVDHDYVLKAAEIAKSEGCRHFLLTSSQGADKNSSFLYPRTKGQVEESLKVMHFDRLSIFRPGVLMCDREERRVGEMIFRALLKPVAYFFPTAITTPTEVVAKAMTNCVVNPTENKTELFENRAIHFLAGSVKKSGGTKPASKKQTTEDNREEL